MAGITDAARRRFGRFITKSRNQASENREEGYGKWLKAKGLTDNQTNFALWLTEVTQIKVLEGQINTIEAGRWSASFKINTMIALILSGVLRHVDGRPYDFNDVMAVLQGEICPDMDEAANEV